MTDLAGKLAAFALLAAFLGILVWRVPRLDLGAVVVITLLLAAYDFFLADRTPRGRR